VVVEALKGVEVVAADVMVFCLAWSQARNLAEAFNPFSLFARTPVGASLAQP
jgi:hypothetical protein